MIIKYLSKYSSLNVVSIWENENDYPMDYCQKFSEDDIIRLQGLVTDTGGAAFPTMLLIDDNGNAKSFTPTYYESGDDGMIIFDIVFQDRNNPLTPGGYYLSIYDEDSSQELYNIPFYVYSYLSEELNQTVRIRYTNNINDLDFNFITSDGIQLYTDFRIEAKRLFAQYTYLNQTNYFRDQDFYLSNLSSVPYTQECIEFGTTTGVPYWVGEKINMIFSLSDVVILEHGEDEMYVRSEGAAIETLEKYPQYSLFTYSLLVEKAQKRYSQKFPTYGLGDFNIDYDNDFLIGDSPGYSITINVYGSSSGGSSSTIYAQMAKPAKSDLVLSVTYTRTDYNDTQTIEMTILSGSASASVGVIYRISSKVSAELISKGEGDTTNYVIND